MTQEVTKIKKRDGRVVDFDQEKITQAIFKALTITGQGDDKTAKKLSDKVVKVINRRFKKEDIPDVEQIQDIVEEVLMTEDLMETARSYILYREQRRRIREADEIYDEAVEIYDKYIDEIDWQVKENSNMAYSLQGLNNYGVSTLTKRYWLNKIYPKQIREAIDSGDFHVHDLDFLGAYCCGWDLYDLLKRGFGGVLGKVESKPAKHLRAALGQVVNFFYTLQGEIAGAVAFSNFDTLLAPFIRYDNLDYPQVKQAMQEFLFNCAVPTRVGFQTPFSNITVDIRPSPSYAEQPVVLGGQPQKETYGDFQEEMNMLNKAFFEAMTEGDKNGRIFTFPIPTINITKDFPWDDPNLEPMWQATAKYGVNYFANFIQSDMNPEDVRSMCLDAREEVLVRNTKKIKRMTIKEIAEYYKVEGFDSDGWAECDKEKNLEVLSLNPHTLKTEWSPVERFFRVFDKRSVEITTADGKKATFSQKHPIAIYTPQGIQMKFAKDVQKGDYLITLKKAGESVLSKEYQQMEDLVLNEDLTKILGYFVADGNYLFENRKGYTHFGEPRGMQFTFKTGDRGNLESIRDLISKVFGLSCKEKQDPRYNTYYLYVYNTELARKLYNAGFKKYGRLPQVLFNSPLTVIQSFLEFYFKGDGYAKRKEIHLNDLELSRDLVLLYSLIGQPVTYRLRKRSQMIYLQHARSKIKRGNGWLNNPILSQRAPAWLADGSKIPGFCSNRTIGFDTIRKYSAQTISSEALRTSDIYIVPVNDVREKNFKKPKVFYDLELAKNHLFMHSLGQISFNCCRLRLSNRELYKRGGGLFGANPLTGSVGVVTINLPRLGYLSKTKKEFFQRLERAMDLAKESLEIKRKAVEDFMRKGLYPYSRHYLEGVEKMRGSYYGNHFSTIGILGMNECLLNFMAEDMGSENGRMFALEVLDYIRERIVKYQEETDNLYNLEATPAEGTSYRLALKDKAKYPDIITAGTKEAPYYTNSSHLPVNYTDDIFRALELQDECQCKYSGGTVLHLFLGEQVRDTEAIKSLLKRVFGQFKMPYITLTPTFSVCPTHGYLSGEHWMCPKCTIEQKCEVYSRIVGYIRPVTQWHEGKAQEFKDRKMFKFEPGL